MARLGWQMRLMQWRLERTLLKCVADRPSLTFGIHFSLGWFSYSNYGPYLLRGKSECEVFLARCERDFEFRPPDFELSADPFNPDFFKPLTRLQRASLREPRGPINGVNIVVDDRACTFQYAWIQDAIDRIHAGESRDEQIPSAVLLTDFSEGVVNRVRSDDVYYALSTVGSLVFRDADHYPKALVAACAVVDWLSDTRNGALEQYFSRQRFRPPRSKVYSLVLSGLERIGHDPGVSLFREAIAIYSHFDVEIERARCLMGIAAVPRLEESNIMSRFYDMDKEIETRLADDFVAHPLEFAVPEWRRMWYSA